MRVCFRVDASFQIGSGHVARCKTLANELRNCGVDCHFLCRDLAGNIIESISRDGFTVMTLLDDTGTSVCGPDDDYGVPHGAWLETDWMTDAHQTIERLKVAETDWLVVDHYALDARWETHVRPYVRKVMVIDDLADRKHACDILLDQNLVPDTELRYRRLISPHCARLIGPQYALLQSAYAALRLRTPPRLGPVRRILVFLAGQTLQHDRPRSHMTAPRRRGRWRLHDGRFRYQLLRCHMQGRHQRTQLYTLQLRDPALHRPRPKSQKQHVVFDFFVCSHSFIYLKR